MSPQELAGHAQASEQSIMENIKDGLPKELYQLVTHPKTETIIAGRQGEHLIEMELYAEKFCFPPFRFPPLTKDFFESNH